MNTNPPNLASARTRLINSSDLSGWFHREAQQQEEQMVVLGHYLQFVPIIIPCTQVAPNAAGMYPADGSWLNVSGNGLHLLTSMAKPGANGFAADLIVSSQAAQVLVRINSEKCPWFPFSLIGNGRDYQYLAATIARVQFRVAVQDGAAGSVLVFTVVNNAGLSSVTGAASSAGSYSVPAGAISGAGSGSGAGAAGSSGGGARSMIRSGGGGQY